MISQLGGVDYERAGELLEASQGNDKAGIAMAKKGVGYVESVRLVEENDGFLRKVIGNC